MTSLVLYGGVNEIGVKTLYSIHIMHSDLHKKISKDMLKVHEGKKYDWKVR